MEKEAGERRGIMLGNLIDTIKYGVVYLFKEKLNDTSTKVLLSFIIVSFIDIIFKIIVDYYNPNSFKMLSGFFSLNTNTYDIIKDMIDNKKYETILSNVYIKFQASKISLFLTMHSIFLFIITFKKNGYERLKFNKIIAFLLFCFIYSKMIYISLNLSNKLNYYDFLYSNLLLLTFINYIVFVSLRNHWFRLLFLFLLILFFSFCGVFVFISPFIILSIMLYSLLIKKIIKNKITIIFDSYAKKFKKTKKIYFPPDFLLHLLLYGMAFFFMCPILGNMFSAVFAKNEFFFFIDLIKNQINFVMEFINILSNNNNYLETIYMIVFVLLIYSLFFLLLKMNLIRKSYKIKDEINEYVLVIMIVTFLIPNFINTFVILPILFAYTHNFVNLNKKMLFLSIYDAIIVYLVYLCSNKMIDYVSNYI